MDEAAGRRIQFLSSPSSEPVVSIGEIFGGQRYHSAVELMKSHAWGDVDRSFTCHHGPAIFTRNAVVARMIFGFAGMELGRWIEPSRCDATALYTPEAARGLRGTGPLEASRPWG